MSGDAMHYESLQPGYRSRRRELARQCKMAMDWVRTFATVIAGKPAKRGERPTKETLKKDQLRQALAELARIDRELGVVYQNLYPTSEMEP